MCGQAKTQTSQNSSYTPTAQASNLYTNAIGKATDAATGTYNPATGKTIADFNPMQTAGFQGVQAAQGTGQQSLDAAGNSIASGAAPIGAAQIANYMDPYTGQVIDATLARTDQRDATAQSTLAGNAASMQALGGNRVGVAQANLAGEQGMNRNKTIADLLSGGFNNAVTAAQTDANRAIAGGQAQMNLGQVQQGMTYNDLQALLAAGGQQQQQQQTVNDAASSNATAQQMFPYQNAQWLAGIASALGPLTGGKSTGTATTATPKGGVGQIVGAGLTAASMLSDRRTKENSRVVGKTFDGQNVHEFNYKGSTKRQLGLMADEVRQSHPNAVGQHPSGFEMVDYGAATDDAAERGHFARGGGIGDMGSFAQMWNELKPASPVMPQMVTPPPAAAPQAIDVQGSVSLGRNARAGIDNVLRKLSPSQGWAGGTTIEPSGFASGGGVDFGALMSLLNRPKLRDEYIGEIGPSGEETLSPVAPPETAPAYGDVRRQPGGMSFGDVPLSPVAPPETAPAYGDVRMPDRIDMSTEAMPTRGVDMGSGIPSMPGSMSLGDVGMSTMSADELQDVPAFADAAPSTETRDAVPGLSTIDFIKQAEGFEPRAKWDRRQYSGGYGTRAQPGEVFTPEKADARLRQEVGQVEGWLDANITAPMTPAQRTALTSFGLNLGVDDLERLKNDANAGRWDAVATRMPSFNKALNEQTGRFEVVDGLTTRRLREAALIRGEGAPPAVSDGGLGAAGGGAPQLVAKATSPDVPANNAYTDKKDKAVGGLLKSMFGVEFNPLKLDENERMAMMAAGLSMMSTGDIGGGGLVGLKYLSGARAADRDAASDAQKLALQMAQTSALSSGKWHPSAGGEMIVNDVTGETRRTGHEKSQTDTPAMKEYSLAQEQGFKGTFAEFEAERKLTTAKGEVPAEVAARVQMGDSWMKDELPGIRDRIRKFTKGDYADLALGRGNAAEVWRRVETGSEALIRMMTGAGKSLEEAKSYTSRYGISSLDRRETMLAKLAGLERDLKAARKGSIEGKTGQMSREYRQEQTAPAAADPLTEARAAIARGAPRERVLKRLEENGISAQGL